MDEKELERLLHDEFASMPQRKPDAEFAAAVIQRIESNDTVALDSRRPLIVGVAFLLGMLIALVSAASLDLYLVEALLEVVSGFFGSVFTSPDPGYWIVILLPLFWMTVVEA